MAVTGRSVTSRTALRIAAPDPSGASSSSTPRSPTSLADVEQRVVEVPADPPDAVGDPLQDVLLHHAAREQVRDALPWLQERGSRWLDVLGPGDGLGLFLPTVAHHECHDVSLPVRTCGRCSHPALLGSMAPAHTSRPPRSWTTPEWVWRAERAAGGYGPSPRGPAPAG